MSIKIILNSKNVIVKPDQSEKFIPINKNSSTKKTAKKIILFCFMILGCYLIGYLLVLVFFVKNIFYI